MALSSLINELEGCIDRVQRIETYLREHRPHQFELDLLQTWATWSKAEKQEYAQRFYDEYPGVSDMHGGTVACIWTIERTAPEFLQRQWVSKVSASRCLRGLYFKTRSQGIADLQAQWVARAMLDHSWFLRRIYDLLEGSFSHRHRVCWNSGTSIDLDRLLLDVRSWNT